jgi:hypothetical protein
MRFGPGVRMELMTSFEIKAVIAGYSPVATNATPHRIPYFSYLYRNLQV